MSEYSPGEVRDDYVRRARGGARQVGPVSRAFKAGRPSPVQERAVSHFHRTLRRFLADPHADDALEAEPLVALPGETGEP